jgi:hypothetical protein
MPFKSKLQARYMNWAANKGKLDSKMVEEFNKSTSFKSLPEKKKKIKDLIKRR